MDSKKLTHQTVKCETAQFTTLYNLCESEAQVLKKFKFIQGRFCGFIFADNINLISLIEKQIRLEVYKV